jgi:hypothetical protein
MEELTSGFIGEAKTLYEKGATIQPQVVISIDNIGTKISLAAGDVLTGSTNDGSPLLMKTSTSYPIGSTNLTLNYLNTDCLFDAICK